MMLFVGRTHIELFDPAAGLPESLDEFALVPARHHFVLRIGDDDDPR